MITYILKKFLNINLMVMLLVAYTPMMLGAKNALATDAQPMQVLLDWYINPDHAPLIVAKQKGFFEEHSLDVELIAPSDPSLPPKLVAAGEGDIAISYQPQLYLHVDQGLDLVRIGGVVATPLNSLVVLEDSAINDLSQLKGKKIGFSVVGMEEVLLNVMLKTEGLSLDDVSLINVNFALTSALASGQVDAVIGAFRNFELTLLELNGTPGRSFFVEEHGVPPHDELIYVTRKELVADPRIARFMAAIEQATTYMLNHPQDALDLLIDYDEKLGDTLNRRAYDDTLRRFAVVPRAVDRARYQWFGAFLLDHGMIKTLPDIETLIADVPLPE